MNRQTRELIEGDFPLPMTNMRQILDYWYVNSMVDEIVIYDELISGRITMEEANTRMGSRFYKIKESN